MITNEVQYRATKAHLERFEQRVDKSGLSLAGEANSNNSNWTP